MWVLTNLDHGRLCDLTFNTLIPPSHESPVVYFVRRSFSELIRRSVFLAQDWHVVDSWQNVAFMFIVIHLETRKEKNKAK